jgi:DNA invertase Pin-like site-specific DNA recombinase
LEGESLSIQNQRDILESFAAKNGFANTRHFFDDGTIGVRFDRDGWQQLMDEVERGNVRLIVTKDTSRLGRDHIQVGMYLEPFRRKGIRFIAITNGVDSQNPDSLEYVPFLNIFAEWFARDTSKKIKAVAHAKGNAGKPMTNNAIYGFKKSPDDKNVWLIDEESAAVVRRIFQMAMEGMGPYQIARVLTMDKVEKPSHYFATHNMVGSKPSSRDLSEPYSWCGGTVTAILSKPEYCGTTVNFRTRKESYKDKNSQWNPKEEWKLFPNTHPAIIEQGTFDAVQKLRGTPRRVDSAGEANPLTGLVFCADCGAKMYNSRQSKTHYEEHRYGKVYQHKTADFYTCSANSLGRGAFKTKCSAHFIRTEVIRALVLDAIREVSAYVRQSEAEFAERIRVESTVKLEDAAKAHKKQLSKNERRIAELDHLFRRVYEDYATQKLSGERYTQLSDSYEREQSELRQQNTVLQSELSAFAADNEKTGRFIELVRRYKDFGELTAPMLAEFIHKILVHEADKSTGERQQDVDIHFNFIGSFEVPRVIVPPTPEELAEQEKLRQKRAKQREANRKWYMKKKAEQSRKSPAPATQKTA